MGSLNIAGITPNTVNTLKGNDSLAHILSVAVDWKYHCPFIYKTTAFFTASCSWRISQTESDGLVATNRNRCFLSVFMILRTVPLQRLQWPSKNIMGCVRLLFKRSNQHGYRLLNESFKGLKERGANGSVDTAVIAT